MDDIVLENVTEENSIQFLRQNRDRLFNDDIGYLIGKISNEEERLSIIKENLDLFFTSNIPVILNTFSNNENKMNALKILQNVIRYGFDFEITTIIEEFSSNQKLEAIELLKDKVDVTTANELIYSLPRNELRLQASEILKHNFISNQIAYIIDCMPSEELKFEAINLFKDKINRNQIIKILNFSKDESKLQVIQILKDKIDLDLIDNILYYVPTDGLKLRVVELFKDVLSIKEYSDIGEFISLDIDNYDLFKSQLAKMFEDKDDFSTIADKLKNLLPNKSETEITLLTNKDDFKLFIEEFKKLPTDESKLKVIEIIKDTICSPEIYQILNNLSLDESKLIVLEMFKDRIYSTDIGKVVDSLSTDELKLQGIKITKNKIDIDKISSLLRVLSTDESKLSVIKMFDDVIYQDSVSSILNNLSTDESKLKVIEILKNKSLIIDTIDLFKVSLSLSNYESQIRLLEMLHDYFEEDIELLKEILVEPSMFESIVYKDLYSKFLKKMVPNYSDINSDFYIQLGKYLTATNDEIFYNLNFKLLSTDFLPLFVNSQSEYECLRVLGRASFVQGWIIGTYDQNPEFCKALLNNIISEDFDYTYLLNNTFEFILRKNHLDLNFNNYNLDLNEFAKKVIYISSCYPDFANISEFTANNIWNCDSIIKKHYDEILKNSTDIEEVKEAVLLKRYGVSLSVAENLINRYAYDLDTLITDSNNDYEKIKVILYDIKQIINEKDLLRLQILGQEESPVFDYDYIYVLDAMCRKMYGSQLSNSLSTVDNMKKLNNNGSLCKQDIYLAYDDEKDNDFYILLTCLGAYIKYERPSNYKNDWLRPKLVTHGFCTSLISNQNMGTARIKYVCLGFSSISSKSLLLQGPYDLVSSTSNKEMDITSTLSYRRSMYMSPKAMINNTRHTHNELVIERLSSDGKLKPDYVIFMTEKYNQDRIKVYEKMTNGEINLIEEINKSEEYKIDSVKEIFQKYNLPLGENLIKDICLECQRWVNAVQASNDFSLPIVVIERQKIREKEVSVINNMVSEFKSTHDADVAVNMLTRFENNRAGCREYYVSDGFDSEDANNIVNTICSEIDSMIEKQDYDKANKCIDSLVSWIDQEKTKIDNAKIKKYNYILGMNVEEFDYTLQTYKQKILEQEKDLTDFSKIVEVDDTDYASEIFDIANYDFNVSNRHYSERQYSIEEIDKRYKFVENLVQDSISDEDRKNAYNYFSKLHGDRHISNVILYTALVGQTSLTGDNKEKILQLAIEASKYHDCGRTDDMNREHASAGAIKSFEILKNSGKYSPLELSIIYTAIYNHEFNYRTMDMDKFKQKLSENSEELFKRTFMSIVKTGFPTKRIDFNEEEYKKLLSNPSYNGGINIDNVEKDMNQVVTLVRDADALDRTRFIDSSRASLNPNYLSNEAKKFVDFAYSLSEYYAKKDLERMIYKKEIDDELIKTIKENPGAVIGKRVDYKVKTYKEIVKFIRNNHISLKGSANKL